MKPIDSSNAAHYTWGEGCDSWVLTETGSLSVKQERMPPGSREQWHFHQKATQFFYILEGRATFYIGDSVSIVAAGQGITVLPVSHHYIANESEAVLEFLVISQPSTQLDRINLPQ